MKLKMIGIAFAMIASALTAQAAVTVSSGEVKPGEWNSHFIQAKAYAEENGIPMVIFWGNPGCGQCAKMKTALQGSDVITWYRAQKYVMVFCEGTSTSDSSACKTFVKNSSGNFPYMGVYWKTSSKTVTSKFTGRSGSMPVTSGTLGQQLMASVTKLTSGWDPSSISSDTSDDDDDEEEEEEETTLDMTPFVGGKTYYLANVDTKLNPSTRGVAIVKAGKATSRGVSRVSGYYYAIDGSKKSLRSVSVETGANPSAQFALNADIGTMILRFAGNSISGTVGDGVLSDATITSISASSLAFKFNLTSTKALAVASGTSVITSLLPTNQTVSVSNGKKLVPGTAGRVKLVKTASGYQLNEVANPSALKLTYTAARGTVTGSFKVYYANMSAAKPTLKYRTVKLTGVVADNVGSFLVTYKNQLIGTATLAVPAK